MSGSNPVGQELKSRSSSGDRDDAFEFLDFEEESDSDSDSFIDVTADEINCLENHQENYKISLSNFPSQVLSYFNPIAADRAEEVPEDDIFYVIEAKDKEKEENETNSKELQETSKLGCVSEEESELNNNEVSLEENMPEVDEDSDNSEVEYNFPELDREEMYLKNRALSFSNRSRCLRSRLKTARNRIRIV